MENRLQLSAEGVSQLQEGINLLLSRWSALQMAVDNEWGGRDSRQKPQQLAVDIFSLLTQSKGNYLSLSLSIYVCIRTCVSGGVRNIIPSNFWNFRNVIAFGPAVITHFHQILALAIFLTKQLAIYKITLEKHRTHRTERKIIM